MAQISPLKASVFLLVVVCLIQMAVLLLLTQDGAWLMLGRNGDLLKAIERNSYNYRQKRAPPKSDLEFTGGTSRCEELQVALVCGGYGASRAVSTLLKSILFYRKNPIHFHFIVDQNALVVLRTLFETWGLPGVNVSFYDVDSALGNVAWIHTVHYSGKFGLVKLVLPDLLPVSLKRVVVLDTDVTLNADLADLWRIFSKFNSKQVIGLVENQSNWYLYRNAHWPALGRGFNTGVVLLALDRLRELKWRHLWMETAIEELDTKRFTQLADQDVINAVIKRHPAVVYRIPCEWNVQLSEKTRSETCYANGEEPKIVHWNSFRKDAVKNKHQDFFQKVYLTFSGYDGGLLRKGVLGGCGMGLATTTPTPSESSNEVNGTTGICKEIRRAASAIYRTHLYFLPYRYEEKETGNDVTMVTQMTSDRLPVFEMMVNVWDGPISVAVFVSDLEAQSFVHYVATSVILRRRLDIAYHVVYKENTRSSFDLYPVNYLRNVALRQVKTSHVFLNDVDFVPKPGTYSYLLNTMAELRICAFNKTALVIPAFETNQYRQKLPVTKKHLLFLWERGTISPFRYNIWKQGHYPVNYTNWKTASKPYEVEWREFFEPYVVVPKNNVPEFDERFVGFGWNKVSHAVELYASGFRFLVVPGAYTVHVPHAPSPSNTRFRVNPKYRKCLNDLKANFVQELNAKYSSNLTLS